MHPKSIRLRVARAEVHALDYALECVVPRVPVTAMTCVQVVRVNALPVVTPNVQAAWINVAVNADHHVPIHVDQLQRAVLIVQLDAHHAIVVVYRVLNYASPSVLEAALINALTVVVVLVIRLLIVEVVYLIIVHAQVVLLCVMGHVERAVLAQICQKVLLQKTLGLLVLHVELHAARIAKTCALDAMEAARVNVNIRVIKNAWRALEHVLVTQHQRRWYKWQHFPKWLIMYHRVRWNVLRHVLTLV